MLKIPLPLIAFLFVFYSSNSQSVWLKGYIGAYAGPQFSLRHDLDPGDIFIDYQSTTSFLFMPALVFENSKGNYWEISLTGQGHKDENEYSIIQVPPSDSSQLVDLGETKCLSLEGNFEFNYQVFRKPEGRWQTYLGWAVNPYWSKYTFTPVEPYIFPRENYVAGADVGVVPRAQYDLTPNLRLDFNACFFVFSANYEHNYWGDPAFTEQQQNSGLFDVGMFEKFWLRAGLAWKIGSKKIEN